MKQRRTRMQNSLADIIGYDGDRSAIYREIGRFVFEYSQLEFDLRRYFRSKVGISLEHNDIMTAGFDFSKLVNALIAASAIEEGGTPDPVLEKHLKACFKVNDTRIAVVHGRWSSTYGGDRAFHVSRNSMKQQKLFEYEGDLDELSHGIVKLRAEIAAAVHAGEERRPKPKKRKRKPRK